MDPQTQSKNTGTGSPPSRTFAEHSRRWASFAYVYPVVSRRSRGLSIGINLNPDTICNFDCVYCQVDKIESPKPLTVDLIQLRTELSSMLQTVTSGELWRHPGFSGIDPALQHLNDIAFSGDGEPTTAKGFPDAVDIVVELKNTRGLHGVKLVLITNATRLSRPHVEAAIRTLDANHGEVWAKLDDGTEAYYKRIDRSAVSFKTILDNILTCGKRRPIVIQSMFAQLHDSPIPDKEFEAYTQRIAELIERGCQIKAVQLYTVARQPLEPYVTAISDEALSRMAEQLAKKIPATNISWYGAAG